MSAKTLLPNQCMPLHFIYGRDDCCLCRARAEIEELRAEIEKLKHPQEPIEELGCDDGYKQGLYVS